MRPRLVVARDSEAVIEMADVCGPGRPVRMREALTLLEPAGARWWRKEPSGLAVEHSIL